MNFILQTFFSSVTIVIGITIDEEFFVGKIQADITVAIHTCFSESSTIRITNLEGVCTGTLIIRRNILHVAIGTEIFGSLKVRRRWQFLTECDDVRSDDHICLRTIVRSEMTPRSDSIGDRIAAVGSEEEIRGWITGNTQIVDLMDGVAVPGFIEGHAHLLGLGRLQIELDLSSAANWDDVIRMASERAAELPAGTWITGRGWHQEKWDQPPHPAVHGYPVHDDLSRAIPDHPVHLRHASGHGSMLWFEVRGGVESGKQLMNSLELWSLAENLGSVESLVTHSVTMTHADMPREERMKAGITDGLVRLSTGLESADDLIADLEQALNSLQAAP